MFGHGIGCFAPVSNKALEKNMSVCAYSREREYYFFLNNYLLIWHNIEHRFLPQQDIRLDIQLQKVTTNQPILKSKRQDSIQNWETLLINIYRMQLSITGFEGCVSSKQISAVSESLD